MIAIYYQLLRHAYERIFGKQQMLHYPLYKADTQNLMEGQIHFTDHCLSQLPDLRSQKLLDIGCGNGVQTIYIHQNYQPQYLYGVDISEMHIQLAKEEKARRKLTRVDFGIENAQSLASIDDSSFDTVICTESAFHYPNKAAFLQQVRRVLRPGGYFLIADLVRRNDRSASILEQKFQLFHWSREKYYEALSRLQLDIVREEDLTELILRGFRTAANWFVRPAHSNWISYHLSRTFGRGLVKLYIYQLEHSLQYQLIIGKRR